MNRPLFGVAGFLVVQVLGFALPAAAQEGKKLQVGVYLPSTIPEGAARFTFAEIFAQELGKQLGRPAVARNFGRFEDWSKAAASNLLDVSVVEGWVVAQAGMKATTVAAAQRAADGGRWAIISRTKVPLKDLSDAKLALVKSPKNGELRFVSNAVFMGDLDVRKHFRIFPVPDVESALRALEAKTVETALVPLVSVPKGANVLYRTPRLPGADVVVHHGDPATVAAGITALTPVHPFEKFTPANGEDILALSALVTRGPPRRACVMAESPLVRVDPPALLRFSEVGTVMPVFTEFLVSPKEQPDD